MADLKIEKASAQYPDDALLLIEEYYEAADVAARDDRATLLQLFADPDHAVWVAYCGEAPAGCILYRPLPELASAGEIKRLFVRPEYRGRRIVLLLLQTLEQFARSRNTRWLYLDSKDDLKDAIAFYIRNGYTSCARYNDNPQATTFMRKQLSAPALLRSFQPGDEDAFRNLNEAWIAKYFRIEAKDRQTLGDPRTYILSQGGQIFMAMRDGKPVGCCALLALSDGSFEVAKMAVAETHRGHGIGRLLLEHSVAFARAQGIRRLYLETNDALADAIHLYESAGFRHLPADRVAPSPYERVNVHMELLLA